MTLKSKKVNINHLLERGSANSLLEESWVEASKFPALKWVGVLFLYLLISVNSFAQNDIVGDGFGGRLWYNPSNYAVGSYSGYVICPGGTLYGWGTHVPAPGNPMLISNNVKYVSAGYDIGFIKNDGSGYHFLNGGYFGIPVKVIHNVKYVDGTNSETLAWVKTDGTVWMTGNDEFGVDIDDTDMFGNLLLDSSQVVGVTTAVRTAQSIVGVAILLSDGTVKVAGDASSKLYPPGGSGTLVTVPGLSNIVAIDANSEAGYALNNIGEVYSWGFQFNGTLGTGVSNGGPYAATKITFPSGAAPIVAISTCTDGQSAFALDANGNVYAWGQNPAGEIGNGTITPQQTPVLVATNVKDIMMGELFSYIIKNDNTFWYSGYGGVYRNMLTPPQGNVTTFTQIYPTVAPMNLCAPTFPVEICGNGLDDDGDGLVDEGCIKAVPDINQTLVNVPVTGTVKTNDVVPANAVFTKIGNPANGTLTMMADGTYIYTPNTNFVGTDSTRYVVCDTAQTPDICDTTTLVIEVRPNNPAVGNNKVIANDDYATTPKDSSVKMCIKCNDTDPDGNTIGAPTVITAPAHGTTTVNSDGTVTYKPTAGYVGEDKYRYYICDNGMPVSCDTAWAYIDVVATPVTTNQTYANDDANSTLINTPVSGTVAANDTDPQPADVSTYTKLTNPAHGTVVLNTNGTYTYTPAPNYVGPDQFTYKKCDNGTPQACDTATVYLLIVAPANTAPIATDDFNNTMINTPVTGNVLFNDTDPEGDVLTACPSLVMNPTNGTVTISANGNYTYIPANNFVGTDVFKYCVCDNGTPSKCDTAVVTIKVQPTPTSGNEPPVANPDATQTPKDSAVKICVKANDFDPENGVITTCATTVTNPLHGTAIVGADGCITYTPTSGYVGYDEFKYCICDNGTPSKCDTAVVSIDVLPPVLGNMPPIAVDDANYTGKNVAVSGTVSGNDRDPDNNTPLTFTKLSNPSHGIVVFNSNGTYTYTPSTDYVGPDQFTYKVCDAGTPSKCDSATVYLTVAGVSSCVSPVVTIITQDTASCWKGVAQADGKVTITVTGADKGDKSTGATYTGPSYGAASNISVSGGSVTFTNLSGGTQYTFRLWNLDNTCYKDTTITTVARTCLPCPTADTLCFGDTLTMTAQAGLTGIVWYKNGVLIAGATGASYDAVVSGEYWYEGKNSSGCVVRPWCPVVLAYKVCGGCGVPQCGTATTVIKKKK